MLTKHFVLSQGRGCSYSYCTKFRRCSTCSQDSACGWCDSSQQCMPGTSVGPYANQCPDWFYYTCYTIGSVNYCSNKIQVNVHGLLTKREVNMAGYWSSSCFVCLWTETKLRSINTQKKNEANIQPS